MRKGRKERNERKERMRLLCGLALLALLITAQPGYGWMQFSADAPDSGLTDNSFVDILYHDGIVWVASGDGVSLTSDGGQNWYTYNSTNGMNSDEPSAMFGRPGQLWVAGSHFEDFEGIQFPFGNGIDMTADGGSSWQLFAPLEASNFAQVVYDLAGDLRSVYAASFHGGFIVSHDNGASWQHLFYSPVDSTDWVADQWAGLETGRYYSCAVDSFHADTGVVYGGTAAGIHKFLRFPKRVKLGGNNIKGIQEVGSFIYLSHENGITQVDSGLTQYYTADTLNGLGGLQATRLAFFGDKLWAGVFDKSDASLRTGLGLYYLNRSASSAWTEMESSVTGPADLWSKNPATFFEGINGGVFDFKTYENSMFFIAAGDSGVFHSLDSGQTWQRFYADSSNMSQDSLRNQVYSIDIEADSIFLGTKAGLVRAAITVAPFVIGSDTLLTFADSDSTGSFVSLVRRNAGTGDSSFTWLGVEPIDPASDSGEYNALMLNTDGTGSVAMNASVPRSVINDFSVTYFTTIIASDIGLFLSPNPPIINPPVAVPIQFAVQDTSSGRTLNSFKFNDIAFVGKRLFTGSSNGFGFLVDTTYAKLNDWRISRANTVPLAHDLAIARTVANSDLPGDWVVAMEIQPYNADSTVFWAACRRVPGLFGQETGVAFSLDFGDTWNVVLNNMQVWNFAFDQDGTTYAAASEGLFYAAPPWDSWQRAAIIDYVSGDTIVDGTEIFSVAVADSILWVGTSLGLAQRPIGDPNDWGITRIYKATASADEVFAAPVPYSPINFNGRLTVHYHVTASADITVEIYDFAMNLVKRLADGKPRGGDGDYFESWDGFNDRGDMVATGIYYIKVTYSTGEEKWGRLAIIP